MTNLTTRLAAIVFMAAFGATAVSVDAYAAKRPYDMKKAECKKRANTMKFGVHMIKKNRWVKDCIAGAH